MILRVTLTGCEETHIILSWTWERNGEKGKATPPLNPRRKKTSNLGRPARVDHPRRPSPAAHAPTQSAAERKDRQREDIGGPVHDSYDGKCHTDRVKRKPDVQRLCGMVPYFCILIEVVCALGTRFGMSSACLSAQSVPLSSPQMILLMHSTTAPIDSLS